MGYIEDEQYILGQIRNGIVLAVKKMIRVGGNTFQLEDSPLDQRSGERWQGCQNYPKSSNLCAGTRDWSPPRRPTRRVGPQKRQARSGTECNVIVML